MSLLPKLSFYNLRTLVSHSFVCSPLFRLQEQRFLFSKVFKNVEKTICFKEIEWFLLTIDVLVFLSYFSYLLPKITCGI